MDYSSEVLRRFDSPASAGRLDEAGTDAPGRVEAEAQDPSLNVWVRFQVQIEGDSIRDVRFQAFGCPHTIAAADYVAEWLRGRPAAALRGLDIAGMSRDLEVPVAKLGKLLRIEDAVTACGEHANVPEPADDEG